MHSTDLIIARYNEPIEWVKDIPENKYNIFIYNKGEPITSPHTVINLPNVGRESHTYLHHIINNYYNLPKSIIFLQGYPFDHLLGIENNDLFKYLKLYENTDILDNIGMLHEDCGHVEERYNILRHLNIDENILTKYPKFSVGAQFAVPREFILKVPLTVWVELQNLHENINPVVCNRTLPCIIERMWFSIFKGL